MSTRQTQACETLDQAGIDFTATFYAAYELGAMASRDSMAISPRAIEALKSLLLGKVFHRQRQRLFLYREAAGALVTIIRWGPEHPLAETALKALGAVLRHGRDQAHRAAAEALGSLPLDIRGPSLLPLQCDHPPGANWRHLVSKLPGKRQLPIQRIGRSIVADAGKHRVMVVKLARSASDRRALLQEVLWMRYLQTVSFPAATTFEVPQPREVKGAPLFRLTQFPAGLPKLRASGQRPLAVCFTASKSYFHYPNPADPGRLPAPQDFLEVMGNSALLLGSLAGCGIIHAAPIPLFHNRVQQHRRRDGGAYEWFRAGRLDRWLDSCAYPNFGTSGLRDFEHFESVSGGQGQLYRYMGNHLLSLLLVAASYFRARNPCRRGWDADGNPIDARDLFDPQLLNTAIEVIYRQYGYGFTGRACCEALPVDSVRLVSRIIEEMGVDRHMEEYLREADQHHMSRAAFERFLLERGHSPAAVSAIKKGAGDLVIHTGPHLGAFNRGISVPELIEAAAAMAATCVVKRFLNDA
jgi:hypothetical protein